MNTLVTALLALPLVVQASDDEYTTLSVRGDLLERRMLPSHEMAYMWHQEFMDEWAREEGVMRLPNGLLIRRVKRAPKDSAGMPGGHTTLRAHYHGVYPNGVVWDSSVEKEKAMVATPFQLLPAWKDALLLMCEGDEVELGLPYFMNFDELPVKHMKVPAFAAIKTKLDLLGLDPSQAPHMPCNPYAVEEAAGVLTSAQTAELAELRAKWEREGAFEGTKVTAEMHGTQAAANAKRHLARKQEEDAAKEKKYEENEEDASEL